MSQSPALAFYDFDGTLVSSNIVVRYAYYAQRHPSRVQAILRYSKLLLSVPWFIGLDLYSRRRFNLVFFREYAGLNQEWLSELAEPLFQEVILPTIHPGARALIEQDRAEGHRLVLVSGELDFALAPVVRYFGFDEAITNSLVFKQGVATGEVGAPLIAEGEKVEAMKRLSHERGADLAQAKAYSDSLSDVPMLEAVGHPVAVNPDRRLRRVAARRDWPILDLRKGDHVHTH
jgi:HAD superfamily hydrolase (TIGR01490 family)